MFIVIIHFSFIPNNYVQPSIGTHKEILFSTPSIRQNLDLCLDQAATLAIEIGSFQIAPDLNFIVYCK